MSTWIILFHLIFPLSDTREAAAAETTEVAADADADGVRYRGLELMFAKFAAEPE
jgi:hypothetical protein